MTTNHRKEAPVEAKTEDARESLQPLPHSVTVDKARKDIFLPTSRYKSTYITTIESVVSDDNIHRAKKAIISNKGAPG